MTDRTKQEERVVGQSRKTLDEAPQCRSDGASKKDEQEVNDSLSSKE